MKRKRSNLFFKFAVFASAVYCIYTLLSLQIQINEKKDQLHMLKVQIEQQQQKNTQLSEILGNDIDPRYMEKIARDKLGLAMPNEKIFINPNSAK
jgi:cell division protein FtsB